MSHEAQRYHVPVMLNEVLDTFSLKPGMSVLDCTIGHAGHALAMSKQISPGGRLCGCDWDLTMLEIAKEKLASITGVATEFANCDYREAPTHFTGKKFAAILLDLGLNSMHLDDPERGISFSKSGQLDMRMDTSRGEPASAFLNRASPDEIERILLENANENWARKVAKVIVETRRQKPLRTTDDLVNCVLAAIPVAMRDKRIHPATRTFQAIRIYINRELEDLEAAFTDIASLLAPGGKMTILSYHSGEDRAAKHAFKELEKTGHFEMLNAKPILPTQQEIQNNPRSRSAKMRTLRAKS